MRHLFGILTFLALFLGYQPAAYSAQGFHLNGATNNITTSFVTTAPMVQTLVNPTTKNMFVSNGCTVALAFTFTNSSVNVAPSSSTTVNPLQIFVNPSSTAPLPNMGAGKFVWIRADTNTCVGGDVVADFY
jgi:hypothetical protein